MVKEKFDGIRELTDEIDHNYLKHCFEGGAAKKDLTIPIMVENFFKYNLIK